MAVVVGLLFGTGLVIVASVFGGMVEPWRKPHALTLLPAPRTVAVAVLCGVVVGGALLLGTRQVPLAIGGGIFGIGAPHSIQQSLLRRRRRLMRENWPEVLDDVVSALRAGLSIGEAVAAQGTRGPESMRPYFLRFSEQLEATGRMEESLDALKEGFADPVADRTVEAMRLASQLGGYDLAAMLGELSQTLRAENRARGELLARQSWTVNGARIAAAAPWMVLALLYTRPGTAQAFSNPLGSLVLLFGLAATVVAYIAMIRIGRLPEEPRVLSGGAAQLKRGG